MKSFSVCIIGNSHIGSLKRGWNFLDTRDRTTFSVTFFGHRANRLDNLQPSGNSLVPTNEDLRNSLVFTSGGKDTITPSEYDIILLYGMSADPWILPSNSFYSSSALKRAADDITREKLSINTLLKIRSIYSGEIYVGHDPLPAMIKSNNDTTDSYTNGIVALNRIIYSELNSEIMGQPLETIVNGLNTEIIHSSGSRRLAVDVVRDDEHHPDDDNIHMNDNFGAIWLQHFFAALRLKL